MDAFDLARAMLSRFRATLEDSGFSDVSFGRFPFPHWSLDVWGQVVTARATPGTLQCILEIDSES